MNIYLMHSNVVNLHFYRATLCVSAVYAVGVGRSRCLYVRLCPHAFVYCIQTAEDIIKLLSRSSSPIILVLPARRSKRGLCYGDVAGWVTG